MLIARPTRGWLPTVFRGDGWTEGGGRVGGEEGGGEGGRGGGGGGRSVGGKRRRRVRGINGDGL